MTSLMWLGWSLGVLAIAAVRLTAYGERRWADKVDALHAGLEAGRLDGMPGAALLPTRYESRELQGLPAPVQRYFRTVLKDGQPIITAVTIDVAGTFNMSATGAPWRPFTSRQRVVARRPRFLCDAKIAMPVAGALAADRGVGGQARVR